MSLAQITYLHYQPKAVPYSYFDISNKAYYSEEEAKLGLKTYQQESIEPLLKYLESDNSRKVNLAISIPVLEFLKDQPDRLKRFKKLLKAGQLEMLAGRGYNSLSALFSRALFTEEATHQQQLMADLLGAKPTGFINTALLHSDNLGDVIADLGFDYAVVPGISWFIKDQESNLFKTRKGDLKLFAVRMTNSNKGSDPVQLSLIDSFDEAAKSLETSFELLSAFGKKRNLVEYSLPELVAQDNTVASMESIVGNNLQKDFLARLTALGPVVADAEDPGIMADFLWLGSLDHFRALANKWPERYKLYTKLGTMLYDLEIRLR